MIIIWEKWFQYKNIFNIREEITTPFFQVKNFDFKNYKVFKMSHWSYMYMYKHVVLMISQNNTFLLATASIWKSAIQTNKKYRCKTKILKIKYDFDFIQRLYFAMRSLSIDGKKKIRSFFMHEKSNGVWKCKTKPFYVNIETQARNLYIQTWLSYNHTDVSHVKLFYWYDITEFSC